MFEHVWVPVIVLPFALLLINRFTYLFDLEWDKINITKFDKVKYRLVDSFLLTLFFFVAIGITVIKTENIDLQAVLSNSSKSIVTYLTLTVYAIYLLVCNYTILRIYFTFIKSKSNIKILLPNAEGIEEEYNFNKGMDGSLHLFKDNYGFDTTIIKQGKVFIEESTIKYKISNSKSRVDSMILNRLNNRIKGLTYEMNCNRKKLVHSMLSIIILVVMLCYVDDSWESIFKVWFIWILWLFLIYISIELLSVFFIPLMVHKFNEHILKILYGIKNIESKKSSLLESSTNRTLT